MDEEKLINLVQKYACLYDVSSRHYSDKLMKTNAWEAISKEMGKTVAVCKKNWKKLRDNYRKALKLRNDRSGAAGGKRRPIRYEKELEFVKQFLQSPEDHQQSNLDSSSEDTQSSGILFPESPQPGSRTSNHSQLRTSEILERYLSMKELESEKHPIDIFFSSMAATTKKLSPRTQAQIKRDVLNIITDAEIREYDEQTKKSTSQDNKEEEYVPTRIDKKKKVIEHDTFMYISSPNQTNEQYYTKEYTTREPKTNVKIYEPPTTPAVQTQTISNVTDTEIYEYNTQIERANIQVNREQDYMPSTVTENKITIQDDRFMYIHPRKPTDSHYLTKYYTTANSPTETDAIIYDPPITPAGQTQTTHNVIVTDAEIHEYKFNINNAAKQ